MLGDAARTRLLAFAGRHFLESERFDRIGMHGRRGVISLECANAGLVGGSSNDWTRVATALHRLGLLPAADLQRVAERQIFGRLIGNSDMHGGNLGFWRAASADARISEPFRGLCPRNADALWRAMALA